jgi:lipoate-protein ligase A
MEETRPVADWRLIDTGIKDIYANMSVDEALIQSIKKNDMPILRFFDWHSPCISIGFSQRVRDVLNIRLCENEGIRFVRRPTGGGIVFHGFDLTYSVILPEGFVKDIYEGYRLIQANVLRGVEKAGINACLYEKIEKPDLLSHCFITPNFGDIIVGRNKLCGLAARRIKKRMLYQGYIYAENAEKMFKYCKGNKTFVSGAVSLEKYGIDRKTVKDLIMSNWPANLVKTNLNDKEEEMSEILYEGKYSLNEWNLKR